MAIQMTRAVRDGILDAIIGAADLFDPAATYVGVGSAIVDTGLDTKIGDITEGTGTGFARSKLTAWGAPHDLIDGRRAVDGPLKTFSPETDDDAMEVAVWFLADALVAGNLLAWGTIVPPVGLANTEESMSVVPRLTVDPDGRWVGETIING